jgi:hypothetical protein
MARVTRFRWICPDPDAAQVDPLYGARPIAGTFVELVPGWTVVAAMV